ncbi:multidrug resistance protein [Aspergillus aculeatinus CBS 121060]|uniref:Multidrug resistance protein n=1 Tax=Aspergillus aculeatinus CBS 121060 TaxID=1448322 RepID=A0ACD1H9V8_9EURO|nr:multidrug resistance protein [Aspergillus aculeatinus CBS 121060]RAH70194.1 multidrug resistance protein [Aspergillus aculeatinus CBS 121060]
MRIGNTPSSGNPVAYAQEDRVQSILQRQLDGLPTTPSANCTVFDYVGKLDLLLIGISTLAAIVAGALNPLLTVVYGLVVRSFQKHANGVDDGANLSSNVSKLALYNVYLGIAEFVLIYIATVGFYHTGERITRNLRRVYLRAIIRQNIAFFDTLSPGEFTARITSDMNVIQEGITSKISTFLTALATFASAVVVAFFEYWKLALMLISTSLIIGGAEFLGAMYALKFSRQSSAALNQGASVVEETISSIRHVAAYGIQSAMRERYLKHLDLGETWGLKARLSVTFMIGIMNSVPYLSYALAFWQGSRYVITGEMSGSAVVTTTMAIIIASFAVGRVAPSAESMVKSVVHAGVIMKAIARQSPLDPLTTEGRTLPDVHGDVEFHDISLVYPSRQSVQVLDQVSLHFPANKTTALVGASGCGKSSIVGLLERFYEPTGGYITLDGVDITHLNLRWLRQQMSYVVQEPVLFNRSIFDNILLGLNDLGQHRTMLEARELVHAAAKVAHAHDFIMALPQGYHTEVGTKGLQLSGGQRQRICIARAVISNPKILLLDEATSALDSKSEKAVQLALDSAARNRTTIVIAHRLSTIRNADNIIVMGKGVILEQGTHEDLMALKGAYAQLVEAQQVDSATDGEANGRLLSTEDDASSDGKAGPYEVSETVNFHHDDYLANDHGPLHDSRPSFRTYFRVVRKLNREEVAIVLTGLLLCILTGFVVPTQAVFFAESISAITLDSTRYSKLRHDIDFWSLLFVILSIFAFITWISQGICFSRSTERLTHKTRDQTFQSIIRQDIAFFDEKRNSPGALTSFVSTTATDITGLSGPIIGSSLTFIAALAIGITVSLITGWKLALVCIATIPIVAGCGYVRLRVLALFDQRVRKTHEEAAVYATEIITTIRSVASLTLEEYFLDEYTAILSRSAAQSMRSILKASALYAASHSFTFFCGALAFWYGGTLLAKDEYTILQFYVCFGALISGAQIAGAVVSYAPDMSKALHAGEEIDRLLNRAVQIDTQEHHQHSTIDHHGAIEFQNVTFHYPSRPAHPVLQSFSLTIHPGQFVALVGPSGSGKTTVLQLLERFYTPTAGQILLNGVDISHLDVTKYRQTFSLVSQEPVLYDGTIRENLLLCGADRPLDDEDSLRVCKEANLYDFVVSLPSGLDTPLGTAGTMLSGGQRQRLALARALLRSNSPVLLLDEATAALDGASERVVQEALDRAATRKTTVAVAHRLRTVQRADVIVVMERGRVVESGRHGELMARRGVYAELVGMQRFEGV